MKKTSCFFTLLLLMAFARPAFSQSATYSIKGVILDSANQQPLPLATVYAKTIKDSTLITYALTDEKGGFFLTGIPRNKTIMLMAYYTGYGHYRRRLENVKNDTLNLGYIKLGMSANMLSEVTVTGEQPPIAIKGDTVEFNASSYKMRPNSALADLLKKLPGIDVDKNGNITANGKTVDQIKVDGKAFFGKDPKIALQNLPSAIIDKVQVTDTKTREEELTGEPATGDTKTINVTLKKGKDHGVFGRAYAGYGTGQHYDVSALLNYFEGKRRISVLGATNNINQIGFTMSEISDLFGGWQSGNIHSVSVNSNTGSFGINGVEFGGGGEGLKKSTSGGFNYNDDYGKHFSVNLSYFYGDVTSDNNTKSERQNILPDSVFYNRSQSTAHSDNLSHRVAGTITYKDSLLHIYYEPNISIGHGQGTSQNSAVSTGEKGEMVNQSNSLYTADDDRKSFQNNFNLYRTFKKKGQYIALHLEAHNNNINGHDYNRYKNLFYQGNTPDDSVNQYINNQQTKNQYLASARYNQPLTKKLKMNIGYELQSSYSLTDKNTYNINDATGKYTEPDTTYSNKFKSNYLTQTPSLGLTFTSDSDRWQLEANAEFKNISLHDYSFTHEAAFDQNQFFLSPQIYLTRKTGKRGRLRLNYQSYIRQPDISQILPVADNTNPLYIVKGNPDLKPTVNRNLSLRYNSFDFKSGNNVWLSLEYNSIQNAIANVTTYDDQLRQLTTYANVNGNYNIRADINLSKEKKKKNYHWQVRLSNEFILANNHAFVNGVPYASKSYQAYPRLSFTYGYKDLYEIMPFYRLTYSYSSYDIQALNNRSSALQEAGLSGTLYFPKNLTWESNGTYSYNNNVAPGFNKGYWLWNASVSLDIFKQKQATLKFSVFDLLNQNVSVHRNITDTYIEDTQTIILHRYFMLKLIYNLRKFGEKKKKKDNGPIFFF